MLLGVNQGKAEAVKVINKQAVGLQKVRRSSRGSNRCTIITPVCKFEVSNSAFFDLNRSFDRSFGALHIL
jgi:hypothetical protein